MIKNFIEKSWLLIIASLAFGVLLAVTNAQLTPRIIQNEIDKFNKLAGQMIDGAKNFESVSGEIKITSAKGKEVEVDVKQATDENGSTIGFAFVAEGSGFADKIKLVITTDAKFETILGFGVLLSNETPGFGDKINKSEHYFVKQFVGTPAKKLELEKIGDWQKIDGDTEIIAITGATITSDAVVSIFNNYVEQIKTQLQEKGLL
jgi:electron transport complex protein RnfG